MAERAPDRLLRMLGMVAYLESHDAVAVDDLAAQFGVTPDQVLADIDTLWVTGTPGYLPYDLIDFDATAYERGVVRLVESRGLARPLRLGGREAVALVAALRSMAASLAPALDDERAAVLRSALAKVTAAAGDAAADRAVVVAHVVARFPLDGTAAYLAETLPGHQHACPERQDVGRAAWGRRHGPLCRRGRRFRRFAPIRATPKDHSLSPRRSRRLARRWGILPRPFRTAK